MTTPYDILGEDEEEEDKDVDLKDVAKNPLLLPIITFKMNWRNAEENLAILAKELKECYTNLEKDYSNDYWIKDNPSIMLYEKIANIQNKMLMQNRKMLELAIKSFNDFLKELEGSNIRINWSTYGFKEKPRIEVVEKKKIEKPKVRVDDSLEDYEKNVREVIRINKEAGKRWRHAIIIFGANIARWNASEKEKMKKIAILRKIEKEYMEEGDTPVKISIGKKNLKSIKDEEK